MISRWSPLAACSLTLLLAAGAHASDPFFKYMPPTANAIMCLNIAKLTNDPLTSQVLNLGSMSEVNAKIQQISMATNMDLQKDLERGYFARDMNSGQDSSVLVVKGKFEPARIRALLQLANSTVGTTTVGELKDVMTWSDSPHATNYLAFLPNNIALMAFNAKTLETALMGDGDAGMDRIRPALQSIAPDFEHALMWIYVENPAGLADSAKAKAIPVKSLAGITDLNEKGISATYHASLETTESAKDLLDMGNGLLALAKLKNPEAAKRASLTLDDKSKTLIANMSSSRPELMATVEMLNGLQPNGLGRHQDASETATKMAERVRRNAEFARKQAELSRKQAQLQVEQARLTRSMRELSADPFTSATFPQIDGQSAWPVAPVPPVPPVHIMPATPIMPAVPNGMQQEQIDAIVKEAVQKAMKEAKTSETKSY